MVFLKEALSVLYFSYYTCLNFPSFFITLVDLSLLTISWSTLNLLSPTPISSSLTFKLPWINWPFFNADHRIILSCTKSVRVLFERRKSKKLKPQDVSYNGQVIPASTSVKFLGIIFDSALTFKYHYHTLANIARHRLLKMNSIVTSTYGPSTNPTSVRCLITVRQLHALPLPMYNVYGRGYKHTS